jgi:hypothetical protein
MMVVMVMRGDGRRKVDEEREVRTKLGYINPSYSRCVDFSSLHFFCRSAEERGIKKHELAYSMCVFALLSSCALFMTFL